MQGVLVGVAALACPIGMGVMMWWMTKGMRRDDPPAVSPSVEALREEHERLGAQIDAIESADTPARR